MSRTIYKYEIPSLSFSYRIAKMYLPKNTKIIHVHEHEGDVYFWGIVDLDEKEDEERKFYIAPTGAKLPEYVNSGSYIGTVHEIAWGLVFHIFEVFV